MTQVLMLAVIAFLLDQKLVWIVLSVQIVVSLYQRSSFLVWHRFMLFLITDAFINWFINSGPQIVAGMIRICTDIVLHGCDIASFLSRFLSWQGYIGTCPEALPSIGSGEALWIVPIFQQILRSVLFFALDYELGKFTSFQVSHPCKVFGIEIGDDIHNRWWAQSWRNSWVFTQSIWTCPRFNDHIIVFIALWFFDHASRVIVEFPECHLSWHLALWISFQLKFIFKTNLLFLVIIHVLDVLLFLSLQEFSLDLLDFVNLGNRAVFFHLLCIIHWSSSFNRWIHNEVTMHLHLELLIQEVLLSVLYFDPLVREFSYLSNR